jgi:hypothetical protein
VKPLASDPFIIGLFSGNQKPGSIHEYLDDFVGEMQYIEGMDLTLMVLRRTIAFICHVLFVTHLDVHLLNVSRVTMLTMVVTSAPRKVYGKKR